MTRFKIIVKSLKPRRGRSTEEDIFLQEDDVVFGYSLDRHEAGKYFDLWFNNPKSLDSQNFITLGRILAIDEYNVITKFGTFEVRPYDAA